MAHQVKVLATIPNSLSLIPGTHMVDRTHNKLSFDLHICAVVCVHLSAPINKIKCKIIIRTRRKCPSKPGLENNCLNTEKTAIKKRDTLHKCHF